MIAIHKLVAVSVGLLLRQGAAQNRTAGRVLCAGGEYLGVIAIAVLNVGDPLMTAVQ